MYYKIVENNKKFVFVFLYCKSGGINLAFDIFPVYSFHIGLFVFCSGYFYKNKNESNLKGYIWKKFKKLIIPMFLWNIAYGVFVQLTRLKGFTIGSDFTLYNLFIAPIIDGHQFEYNLCFWFIPSLFLIEIMTCFIRKIVSKFANINEYIFFIFYWIFRNCFLAKNCKNTRTNSY